MTKEVDLLSLSKVSTNKSSSSSANTQTKKEGMSLFDSLLVNSANDNKTTKENSLSKDNNSSASTLTNPSSDEVNTDTNKTTKDNAEVKNSQNKENNTKVENKTDNSTNITNTKESEKNSETKATQSSSSVLDKIIIDSKTNNKSSEIENLTKNINANNTESENQNKSEISSKNEVVKNESSLLDKLIKEAKVQIQNEKNVETSLEKENKTSTSNTIKSDSEVEESLNKTSLQETKIESSSNLVSKTVETKQNDSVSAEIINKNNSSNDSETKQKSENKIENKIDIKKNENEVKTTALKEQIQTTLDFEENSNEKVKTEAKSTDITKNILEKNSSNLEQNLENKIENEVESKIESKPEVKAEIKNNILEENTQVQSEKVNSNTTNASKNINETVSKEFAKLDANSLVDEEQKINIDKNLLKENTPEVKNSKSLMDRLLDNATKTVNISSNNLNQDAIDIKLQNSNQSAISKSNDFMTNMFLGSQKNSIYNQMIANKSEGVKVVKDGSSLEDIKKGAEILNLGLKETSVETKVQNDTSKTVLNQNLENKENTNLNKLAFNRNITNENIENKLDTKIQNAQNQAASQSTTSTSSAITTTVIEEPVSLTISPSLALSIQNRIIGAQQQMSSMMSDVARNMYENYKPPVTAFRINLFPAQLGHIAILMKNDKENSISISLNMSNSSTLDAFVENQNVLRDALNRNFNNNQTTFNLDFNMDNNSSQKESFDGQNQENNKNNEAPSSNEILEAINQNQNVGEDLNYL